MCEVTLTSTINSAVSKDTMLYRLNRLIMGFMCPDGLQPMWLQVSEALSNLKSKFAKTATNVNSPLGEQIISGGFLRLWHPADPDIRWMWVNAIEASFTVPRVPDLILYTNLTCQDKWHQFASSRQLLNICHVWSWNSFPSVLLGNTVDNSTFTSSVLRDTMQESMLIQN